MENKNLQDKIKSACGMVCGVIALGLSIGGFMYTPKPSNEFLDKKHKIDSTYNVKKEVLFNSYILQKNFLEKDYLNQFKDLRKEFKY